MAARQPLQAPDQAAPTKEELFARPTLAYIMQVTGMTLATLVDVKKLKDNFSNEDFTLLHSELKGLGGTIDGLNDIFLEYEKTHQPKDNTAYYDDLIKQQQDVVARCEMAYRQSSQKEKDE